MAEDNVSGFHWLDYVLFAGMLLVSLGIGVYAALSGGKQKTTSEYLVGNRQLSVLPVAASIFMSFISAILILGNTAEMYQHRGELLLQAFGGAFAFCASAIMFVPILYPLNLTSAFQYFIIRYKAKHTRIVGDILLMISLIIYMGVATYAPSTALEGVTGFPDWATIMICGIVSTIYTSIGGMKAVVWTDTLQGLVYLIGVLTVLAIGTHKVGGVEKVWTISQEQGRLDLWNFNLNPFGDRLTFWSSIIGGFFVGFGFASSQTTVQRFCSLKNVRDAKMSMFILAPAFLVMFLLTGFTGLVVFAYYHTKGCDPLRAGYISNSNQLLPRFIMEEVAYPGLPGIFMSVLFAGALSSLSSSISALAAITWKDLLEPFFPDISEIRKTVTTKILSFIFGVAATVMAFVFKYLKGHVLQLAVTFVTGCAGPILGMFLAGFIFPSINAIGVSIGALFGLAITMWLAIGQTICKPYVGYLDTNVANCSVNITSIKPIPTDPDDVFILYRVSFMWFSLIGVMMTVISSLIISAIAGSTKRKDVDPALMFPLVDYILPCLPKRYRRKFRYDVAYDNTATETKDDDVILKTVSFPSKHVPTQENGNPETTCNPGEGTHGWI